MDALLLSEESLDLLRNGEVTGVIRGTSTSKRGATTLDSSHFLFCWSHIAEGVL